MQLLDNTRIIYIIVTGSITTGTFFFRSSSERLAVHRSGACILLRKGRNLVLKAFRQLLFGSQLGTPSSLDRDPVVGPAIAGSNEFARYCFDEQYRGQREEERRRKEWVLKRLWHNGPHAHCCKRCMQAGYVMALLHAGRLDLMSEYPELNGVYEELLRDGMISGDKREDFRRAGKGTADRSTSVPTQLRR
jgi:hypothetical protein